MRFVNDLNMPDHAFKAICLRQGRIEPPKLDYIGVSALMGAPLPRYLHARYWHQLEVKASETMNALQGQMGHLLFDKVETDTETEIHLKVEFEGTRIMGVADYYDPKLLTLGDAKFKQVNAVTATNIRGTKDLETQLNIYCWMARRQGLTVEHLQGDIYINGWVVYKAYGDSAYPKAPYLKLSIPVWEEPFTANYVRERLNVHDTRAIKMLRGIGVTSVPDLDEGMKIRLDAAMLEIPVCTDEERFMQPTKWAVMREGQKKAVKLFDRRHEAWEYIGAQAPGIKIKLSATERKGGYMKCLWYCNVAKFCPHNKTLDKNETAE
uniref:PD-(D/E)XK nuclease superfamily protein n=1 Tax=viral metagenome TaxID=1070528 RepID=A0A6M3IYX4_9ZZZZ